MIRIKKVQTTLPKGVEVKGEVTPELAEIPGEDGIVVNGVRVRASHVNPTDTLEALNDGLLPKSSDDHAIPRMTWWDHRGTTEWVSYRFPAPRRLSSSAVYWFDDTGRGQCRVPASWRARSARSR